MPSQEALRKLPSRFAGFLNSAKVGFNGDLSACAKTYKRCPYGGTDVLDRRFLHVLQLLGRKLNIKFIDR
jgi:hypothetical protein